MNQFYLIYGEKFNGQRDESVVYWTRHDGSLKWRKLENGLKRGDYETIGHIHLLTIPKDAWSKKIMQEVIAYYWQEKDGENFYASIDQLEAQSRATLSKIIKEEINL